MKITKPKSYSIFQYDEYHKLLEEEEALGFYTYCTALTMEEHVALFNSFEEGQKTQCKENARLLMKLGSEENRNPMKNIAKIKEIQKLIDDQLANDKLYLHPETVQEAVFQFHLRQWHELMKKLFLPSD